MWLVSKDNIKVVVLCYVTHMQIEVYMIGMKYVEIPLEGVR